MAELDNTKDANDFGIGIPVKQHPFFLKGLEHADWGTKDRLSRIFNRIPGLPEGHVKDHADILTALSPDPLEDAAERRRRNLALMVALIVILVVAAILVYVYRDALMDLRYLFVKE